MSGWALGIGGAAGCRGENKTSSDMQVYGASKLYNIMVAKAWNERLKGTGVEAFSAHPGEHLTSTCTVVKVRHQCAPKPYDVSQSLTALSMRECRSF